MAIAIEPKLHAMPDRCVALHEGQVCYQRIRLLWGALDKAYDYCVVEQDTGTAVHCWLGGGSNEIKFEFGSNHSQIYQLKRNDGLIVSEVEIVVAWVYKSSRKRSSGWRLF